MLRNARALLAVLALVLPAAPAAADRVPGTSVTLDPPPGFAPARRFSGFQQDATGSSIVVTELPGPVSEVTAAMTADGMATQGMRLLESSETSVAGRSALLLHAAQSVSGIEFEKWTLAFGEQNRTVLVVATFPKAAGEQLREPLRAALLTVKWSPQVERVRTEGLPFAIAETPELKITRRVSNTLLLGKPGTAVKVDPADPLVVVGVSIHDIKITDVASFARDRIQRTSQITGVSGIVGESVRVDGLDGYELRAEARDQASGTPLRVYQLLLANSRQYFLVQGLIGADQAEHFLPQFRAIGRSLRRK
jgi:hypothetical protein